MGDALSTASAPPTAGLCLGCNYPLRGLDKNRCPECGRAFDPDDPWTMNVGRPMPPLVKGMAAPIGRGVMSAHLAACLMILWGTGWLPGGLFVAAAGLVLLAYVYVLRIVRFAVRTVAVTRYRQPRSILRPGGFRDYLPMIVFGVTGLSVATSLPLRVTAGLNHLLVGDEMHRMYTIDPMEPQRRGARRVGIFYASDIFVSPSGITIGVYGAGDLVYDPDGNTYPSWHGPHHLVGPWHAR